MDTISSTANHQQIIYYQRGRGLSVVLSEMGNPVGALGTAKTLFSSLCQDSSTKKGWNSLALSFDPSHGLLIALFLS